MDAALVARLRADLDRAGYTVDGLRELWGEVADDALARDDRVPALRALAGRPDAAAALARLWILGDPVSIAEVDRALPETGADGARALGLVADAGTDLVRGAVDLRPYSAIDALGVASWWLVSDLGELALGGELPEDHVLGVGGASTTLSGLMLPDPVHSVLDLGTGSGIQALHATRIAPRVVATDVSERALRFARLGALLNGVEIDVRLGSLFEPVAGKRFDRVVSNPPFVITPRSEGVPAYEYRDGGAVGDALLAGIVAALPEHLEPGGIAQLLGNWETRDGVDGLDRAAGWALEAGLEHWIVERDRVDPARYAETWIRDGGTRPGSERYERLVGAWLDDFAARGVEAVGFGYLLLRLPDDPARPPLRRAERLPEAVGANPAGLGEHLSAVLAARDVVAAMDDRMLAAHPLRVAPDVTEERSHWPGQEHPSAIVLRQGGGFGRTIRADSALAAVVGACDGELPLGVIAAAVAELLGLDVDAVTTQALRDARELVECGILTP